MTITLAIIGNCESYDERCRQRLMADNDIQIVADSAEFEDATDLVEETLPDILLLDGGLLHKSGSSIIPLIHEHSPTTRVILLSDKLPEEAILACLTVGAQGYLERDETDDFLIKAIKAVATGEAWVPRRIVARLLERLAWINMKDTSSARSISA